MREGRGGYSMSFVYCGEGSPMRRSSARARAICTKLTLLSRLKRRPLQCKTSPQTRPLQSIHWRPKLVSLFLRDTQELSGLFNTCDRQFRRIEQPHLDEQRCLVPVNMLVCDFPVLELHNHNVRKFDIFPRRRNSWQQVIPLSVVSETHDQFVHNAVFADCAGNRRDCHVLWNLVYEMLAVKPSHCLAPDPAGHHWNTVHIRLSDHRFHRGVYVLVHELSRDV